MKEDIVWKEQRKGVKLGGKYLKGKLGGVSCFVHVNKEGLGAKIVDRLLLI